MGVPRQRRPEPGFRGGGQRRGIGVAWGDITLRGEVSCVAPEQGEGGHDCSVGADGLEYSFVKLPCVG